MRVGEPFKITAGVSGQPKPTIIWTCNDIVVQPDAERLKAINCM